MSLKIMSAIFETEFRDLPTGELDNDKEKFSRATSIKITMLALADHANDDGECFPGYDRLEIKTGLSRPALADAIKAIRHNGLAFVSEEKSKYGTNFYTINLSCFPKLQNKEDQRLLVSQPNSSELASLTTPSKPGLLEPVSQPNLNPQLTQIKPSLNPEDIQEIVQSANKTVDGVLKYGLQPENYWKGREYFRDNHLIYADWYHDKTNQICGKRQQRSWQKAFLEWQDEGLEVGHLQKAYTEEVAWRKFITDPNELTKKAIAIKAIFGQIGQPESPKSEQTQMFATDDNDIPISY